MRAPPPSTPPALDPVCHVLVVEDDRAVLDVYSRILRSAGHRVTGASGVSEALLALRSADIDVVMTDMGLPDGTGLDVLDRTHAEHPDLPVLFATGSVDVEHAVRALERGALKYLVKPVEPAALRAAVDSARRIGRRPGARTLTARELANLDVRFDAAMAGLSLAWQPIVRWSDRTVIAWEALARTREASLRRPDRLVAAAETLGRTVELGRAVRAQAAAFAATLEGDAVLHVNVHPFDLADPDLYRDDAPLSRHAARVVLEVTERDALDRLGDLDQRVAALRRLGYRIALDDLGAGYSGLAAIAAVHPEIVKLDIALVRGVASDPVRRLLVEAIRDACGRVGVALICEGVEHAGDLEALLALGCDVVQGYLFGQPASKPAVTWPELPLPLQRPRPRPQAARAGGAAPTTVEYGSVEEIACALARGAGERAGRLAIAADRLRIRELADGADELAGTIAAIVEILEGAMPAKEGAAAVIRTA